MTIYSLRFSFSLRKATTRVELSVEYRRWLLSTVILPISQADGDVVSAAFMATTYPPERNTHARGLRSPRVARARAQIASSAVVVSLDPDFARPYANTNAFSLTRGRLPRLIAPGRPRDTRRRWSLGEARARWPPTRAFFSLWM